MALPLSYYALIFANRVFGERGRRRVPAAGRHLTGCAGAGRFVAEPRPPGGDRRSAAAGGARAGERAGWSGWGGAVATSAQATCLRAAGRGARRLPAGGVRGAGRPDPRRPGAVQGGARLSRDPSCVSSLRFDRVHSARSSARLPGAAWRVNGELPVTVPVTSDGSVYGGTSGVLPDQGCVFAADAHGPAALVHRRRDQLRAAAGRRATG